MSIPHFPSEMGTTGHGVFRDIEICYQCKRKKEWKKEHEKLYYCIPKEDMDGFFEWLDNALTLHSEIYVRNDKEYEEKKKSLLEPNK